MKAQWPIIIEMAWLQPPALGCRFSFLHLPCGRCGHSMSVRSKSLVLFGGFDGRRRLNDLHIFDTSSLIWTQPKTLGASPHPRQYHSAEIVDEILYLFGGYDGTTWPSEIVTLDFRDLTWRIPKATGDLPRGREGHSMCAIGSTLYVHGGWDCGVINDFHSYDTQTSYWTKIATTGKKPAVCGHSVTLIGRTFYLFGGYDGNSWMNTLSTLDLDTLEWKQPAVFGSPLSRGYHSAAAVNSYILVFAGYNGSSILGDLLALDTTTLTWTYPEPCFGRIPAPRNAHSMTLLGSELYIFGGYNGTRDVNELQVLETAVFSTLQEDFKDGFYEGIWQDLRVYTSTSSQTVSAALMKARCPLLFMQARDGAVEIEECSAKALQLFCENLYSDIAPPFNPNVQDELLYLAVTYCQPRLQAYCFGSSYLPDSTFIEDMGKLLEADELCDLTVKTQGRSFEVHKFVVASRCPYFKALLVSGMCETRSASVELPQVSADAFEIVVEWMYTDKFSPLFGDSAIDVDLGVQVMLAANMLGLSSLMRMAEIALQRPITPENVLALYETSHLINAVRLMSYCLNFVLRDFDSVSGRREFLELSIEAREDLGKFIPRRLRRQSSLPAHNSINSVLLALREAEVLKNVEVTPRNPVTKAFENKASLLQHHKLLNVQGVRADHCMPTKPQARPVRRRKELSPLTSPMASPMTSPKRGKLAPLMQRTLTLPTVTDRNFDFVLTGSNASGSKPFRSTFSNHP